MDKEMLLLPHKLKKKLHYLLLKKSEYEKCADSIPGGNYDEPVIQKTRNTKAPFIKWLDKILEVEKEIESTKQELEVTLNQLLILISYIPNEDYQHILILYYINEETILGIAEKMFFAERTVYRYKYLALKEFENLSCSGR